MQHDRKGKVGVVRRLRSDERGIAMVSVGLLGAFVVLISVVVAIRTLNTSTSVDQDRSFEQAIHVAESGADQALYALDTGADLAEVTLSADPTKAEVVTAAEKLATDDPTEIVTTPEGEVVVIKDATTDTAFAVGFSPGINSANRSARVIVVDYEFVLGDPHVFPTGAVIANGDVDFAVSPGTTTAPASGHSADIHTNGNFTAGGGGSDIDGDVSAAGTVSGANAHGSETSGASPVEFPAQAVTDAWQAELKSQALEGPTLAALSGTVNAPAYLPSSLNAGCTCTVTLSGPGVIYIDGSLDLTGKINLVNNGVTLVTADYFAMTGQSAYSVTGDPAEAGLISFSDNKEAVKISGLGDAFTQGFVYAPNGGVKVSGNGAFVGAIIAGDDVKITNKNGIIYPDGLTPGSSVNPPSDFSPKVDTINELNVNEL